MWQQFHFMESRISPADSREHSEIKSPTQDLPIVPIIRLREILIPDIYSEVFYCHLMSSLA